MNRRRFLRALVVAPVAVPVIAALPPAPVIIQRRLYASISFTAAQLAAARPSGNTTAALDELLTTLYEPGIRSMYDAPNFLS